MKTFINSYKGILIAAIIVRVMAAVFSPGYGMHDDHFLIIEASSSWTDDYDYNHWLPSDEQNRGPEGHSFSYVGLNYVYFMLAKGAGISDPKVLMLINRLIHALFSVLIVLFSIRITEKLASREKAIQVGWILALLWILPFLSVRNLVEVTCIPFILWSVWWMIRESDLEVSDQRKRFFFFAGLLMGMAVSFRFQVGVFAIGFAAYYFFTKRWWAFTLFSTGVLVMFSVTQGLVDFMIWGYPFAEFIGYFTYNMNEGTEYIVNDNYFMYFLVLMGALLFPLGLLMGAGFFASVKKYFVLFLPAALFILFHTFYPSKQERFILPVLPFFIILGVLGFDLLTNKEFWTKFWKGSTYAFWVLNIPLMILLCFTYSKKSRVEAMYYFYEEQRVPHRVLYEGTGETKTSMMPRFYAGWWQVNYDHRNDPAMPLVNKPGNHYDEILFFGQSELDARVKAYRELYPGMERVKICEPSLVDKFLRWLNPRNANEYIEVWRTNYDEMAGIEP